MRRTPLIMLPDEVLSAISRSDRYSLDIAFSPVKIACLANALVKREGIYPGKVDDVAVASLIEQGKRIFGLSDLQLAGALMTIAPNSGYAHTVASKRTLS